MGIGTAQNKEDSLAYHHNENLTSQEQEQEQQQQQEKKSGKTAGLIRVVLLIFAAFYSTFCGGAVGGWGAMQLLLEKDGAFHDRCNESTDDPDSKEVCSEQTARLLSVQTVSQCILIFSPLLGHISDYYGHAVLMDLVGSLGIAGVAMLAIAAWLEVDSLLYPAFLFIYGMTQLTCILMVKTGLLFEPVTRRRVITTLNALFDILSMTYVVFWVVTERLNLTLEVVVTGYLVPVTNWTGGLSLLWHIVTPQEESSVMKTEKRSSVRSTKRSTVPSAIEAKAKSPKGHDENNGHGGALNDATTQEDFVATRKPSERSGLATNYNRGDDAEKLADDVTTQTNGVESPARAPAPSADVAYVVIAERKQMEQLTSGQFILVAVFFAFMHCRNYFVVITARDFLGYLGDDEFGHRYLFMFTLFFPLSLAALPFIDSALARYGYHAGLQCINALAILHGIIQVSSTNLNVQVAGFVVFSFFRCFTYAISFSFLPTFLSPIGKSVGILQFVAGIAAFANIPLANVAVTRFDGNFFWPNALYVIVNLLFVYIVWRIGKNIEREEKT